MLFMQEFPDMPMSPKIASLSPIERSAGEVLTREAIKDIVEPALVKACEHLYDKNIRSISSSANQKSSRSSQRPGYRLFQGTKKQQKLKVCSLIKKRVLCI